MMPTYRKSNFTGGLTLVELLVSMFIFGILIMLVANFFTGGSNTTIDTATRAELQQEILNSQQLIAANVKEAWFVVPPGTNIQLNNGRTTENPVTGTNNWIVGDLQNGRIVGHPMLAVILPPQTIESTCTSNTPEACYQFRAYFPVLRSTWVEATASDSWRNPGASPNDDANTWVMAEFRANYLNVNAAGLATPPNTAALVIPAGTTNLLADYIAPSLGGARDYAMFTFPNNSTVGMNIAALKYASNSEMRLPSENAEYSIMATTQNVGRILNGLPAN